QLLSSTSKSVAEVAGDVGYESEPSFNRAFKRELGLPPAAFRNRARSFHQSVSDTPPPRRRVPSRGDVRKRPHSRSVSTLCAVCVLFNVLLIVGESCVQRLAST